MHVTFIYIILCLKLMKDSLNGGSACCRDDIYMRNILLRCYKTSFNLCDFLGVAYKKVDFLRYYASCAIPVPTLVIISEIGIEAVFQFPKQSNQLQGEKLYFSSCLYIYDGV